MWSKYVRSVDGTLKLYIGTPSTMVSALRSSSMSASEYATIACCSGVRASGAVLKAWKRSAVRCGAGSAARSRLITRPPGLFDCHCATKRSASCDDAPCAPYKLLWTYNSVLMILASNRLFFRWAYSTIELFDKKAQILARTYL